MELPEVLELKEGMVAVDCGCFLGDTPIILGHGGACVFAWEPQIDAFIAAAWNTLRYPNIHVFHGALGNGETVACNEDPINGNLGTRTTTQSDSGFKTFKLDDFPLEKWHLGKYDCEGHEYQALKGSVNMIHKFKPKLLIEVYRPMLALHGSSEDDIYEFLQQLGYEWKVVIGDFADERFDILATYKEKK